MKGVGSVLSTEDTSSAVVDLHLALRTPCNLVRIDQATYNQKTGPQKASLDRLLADGILGYSMVITDPIMCGYIKGTHDTLTHEDTHDTQVAMGVAYIWDELYVEEKGIYEEHEIISILFYHLHQLRRLDSISNLRINIHASSEIKDICRDRGMGNSLELIASVCSAQNLKDTSWLIPTFSRVKIVVDALPERHEDPENFEIINESNNTGVSPALAAVASMDQADANVPMFVMGNEFRANLYTGKPMVMPKTTDSTLVTTVEKMKMLSDVSEKIAVVTCARISQNGDVISNTVKFHQHIGHELAQQMYTSAVLLQKGVNVVKM